MMTEGIFFDTMRQGLWTAVLVSTPILSVALVTGLTVGLFQALTSIQEMTLTFVPKLGAVVLALVATLPWILQTLVAFFVEILQAMPTMAG